VFRNSTSSLESFVLQPSASPNRKAFLRASDLVLNAHGLSAQPLWAMARENSPGIEVQLITHLKI
jgi:hypothetical protein